MPIFKGDDIVHARLNDLEAALDLEDSEPVDILICGGAALAVSRATEELVDAAKWCLGQDPSEGFRKLLLWFLDKEGYADVLDEIS